jgi:hypothetical protein
MRNRLLAIVGFALLLLFFAPAQASSTPTPTNTNDTPYWALQLETAGYTNISCYKYGATGTNDHGGVYTVDDEEDPNDGKTYVELNEFQDSWPGDQWVLLIVKGGSTGGDGNGNAVYFEPDHGVPYFAPINSGGQQADVSHWIVCKGTVPATTTTTTVVETTTTTEAETTTTTEAETTTTTEAETTTTSTTVPEETTTTTEAETTTTSSTTVPEETTTTSTTEPEETTTTTTVDETTTTQPDGSTTTTVVETTTVEDGRRLTPQGSLPRTGLESRQVFAGIGLLVLGVLVVLFSRQNREDDTDSIV